jgi:hypothetical protein
MMYLSKSDAMRFLLLPAFCFFSMNLIAQETSENQIVLGDFISPFPENGNAFADSVNKGLIAVDIFKKSVPRIAKGSVGKSELTVYYYSPGVRGRIIWGGLVPFEEVWVTGAHFATTIKISNPIMIGENRIEKGTYALFTIPRQREWMFILNKNYQQHLAERYDSVDDVVRIPIAPLENPMTQRLTYQIMAKSDRGGAIEIFWEKLKLTVPFVVAE